MSLKDINVEDFGIGLIDPINDKDTSEIYESLHKLRSKVFDTKGKIVRQTLTDADKRIKNAKKILDDPKVSDVEKKKIIADLIAQKKKELADGK